MRASVRHTQRSRFVSVLIVVAVVASLLSLTSPATLAAGGPPLPGKFPPHWPLPPQFGPNIPAVAAQAPTDAWCRANTGGPCYSPQEIRRAYGLTPILNAGFTGKGQTIVIVDSYGSPTIAQDLQAFDAGYGLPDPPSLQVIAPLGTVPFDNTNSEMVGWAFETTLDVEWAHAMAPGASIDLLTSPVDETEGVQGLPEFLSLETYALDHHLGQILSQSWGATENTLFDPAGEKVLDDFESFYARAAREHVTVFAAAGDTGAANTDVDGNYYPFPTVGFPASSPLVTAVGGTSLYADTNGRYQHETVWNESVLQGGAGGGGISQYFSEPGYQGGLPRANQRLLQGHRGLPDLAFNGDPYTSILVYVGFLPAVQDGYYFIGGTSEGSPQWAGIIADANQMAGAPLGYLNPALSALGASGDIYEGFHDVTVGNNSYAGVTGYNATRGWDLCTGWGTPNLSGFVRTLARQALASN